MSNLSFFTICCLLVALVPITGCPNQETTSQPLRVVVQNEPESLDLRVATSSEASEIGALLTATLFRFDQQLIPAPFLAESYQLLNDRTYLVSLRKGIFFQNGSPITAQDVVYSFNSVLEPKLASPLKEKLKGLTKVEAVGTQQIKFELSEPFAPFLTEISSVGILSKSHCEQDADQCSLPTMSSGPFQLEKWDKARAQIWLRPNRYWFEGQPKIDHIEIATVRDATTRTLELLSGKAHLYIGSFSPQSLRVLKEQNSTLQVQSSTGLGYSYLAMNLRGPTQKADPAIQLGQKALTDPRVRRAIYHALNIPLILHTKYLDTAVQATGMLPPDHWAKDPTLKPLQYDPALARQLLDEAGYPDRGKKMGGRFTLSLSASTDRFRQSIALIFKSQLEEVGILTQVRVQDWGALYQDIKVGNFGLFSAKWLPVIEPDLMYWVFHSSNIPSEEKAGGNRGAFKDAQLDDWLFEGRITEDHAMRSRLYKKAESRLMELLPYIPLWFESEVAIINPRLTGFKMSKTSVLLPLRYAQFNGKHEQ